LLLETVASINAQNNEVYSPLYVACRNGHHSIVSLLLENGAKVNNIRNPRDGAMQLHFASVETTSICYVPTCQSDYVVANNNNRPE
jgi:ankyrin repeat protein